MPLKKQNFKGVGEDVNLVDDECAWAMVEIPGLGVHATNALRRSGWKGTGAVVTVIVAIDDGVVKGASWALRGNLGKVRVPMRRITKDLEVVLDLGDLSGVKFPTMTDVSVGGGNHSEWINGLDYVDSVVSAGTTITDKSEIAQTPFLKDKGFSLR